MVFIIVIFVIFKPIFNIQIQKKKKISNTNNNDHYNIKKENNGDDHNDGNNKISLFGSIDDFTCRFLFHFTTRNGCDSVINKAHDIFTIKAKLRIYV